MKKLSVKILLLLTVGTWSCTLDNNQVEPTITEPPFTTLISSDTIVSGSFLGIAIASHATDVYQHIQSLPDTEKVAYINIVSNFATNFADLQKRLPLYSYFWLDEAVGTDTGVQVNLEDGNVTSIFLGSGKSLSQWPTNANSDSSLRLGDNAAVLYDKLVKIKANKDYTKKFERILLLTKNLSTAYDTEMTQSPQWYFAHEIAPNKIEEVKIYFKAGLVSYMVVNRYGN